MHLTAARYRGILACDAPNACGANLAVRADAFNRCFGWAPGPTAATNTAAVVVHEPAPGGLAELLREISVGR
ncbi:hypothetical protein AB0383_03460 [Amycolatopsis sp. NPDC051373]|uniref:hypothetical protein n=1 Tax=Amycolatopsis sp. NPDC051373 TaxID=3155801 RepID=UPI00344F71AB